VDGSEPSQLHRPYWGRWISDPRSNI